MHVSARSRTVVLHTFVAHVCFTLHLGAKLVGTCAPPISCADSDDEDGMPGMHTLESDDDEESLTLSDLRRLARVQYPSDQPSDLRHLINALHGHGQTDGGDVKSHVSTGNGESAPSSAAHQTKATQDRHHSA